MAISVVVEDGTGVAGANSYVTTAAASTFLRDRGLRAFASLPSDIEKNAVAVEACLFIEQSLERRWEGVRFAVDQARAWPRAGALNRHGETYESDEIPAGLVEGQILVMEGLAGLLAKGETVVLSSESIEKDLPAAWQRLRETLPPFRRQGRG